MTSIVELIKAGLLAPEARALRLFVATPAKLIRYRADLLDDGSVLTSQMRTWYPTVHHWFQFRVQRNGLNTDSIDIDRVVEYKGKPLTHYMEQLQQLQRQQQQRRQQRQRRQRQRQQRDEEAEWEDSSSSEEEAEDTYEEQDDEEEEPSDKEEQEEEEEGEEGEEEVSVPHSRSHRAAGHSAVPTQRQRQQVAGEPGAEQASLPGAAAALARQQSALAALGDVAEPLEKIQAHAEFQQTPGGNLVLCHGLSPDVEHCAKARWKAFASKRQPSSGSHKIPREAGWRVRDILSAARVGDNAEEEPWLPMALDSCARALEQHLRLGPGERRFSCGSLLKQLPSDPPVSDAVEVCTVPETDVRVALRGKKGLSVKQGVGELPAGTFIGWYRGEIRFKYDHDLYASKPPTTWPETCPVLWEAAVGSYVVETESWKYMDKHEKSEGNKWDQNLDYTLHCSAYGCGNATMRANAPQVNPFEVGGEGARDANCDVRAVLVGGWPFKAMFTTKAVKAGQQLLYDYGHGYWSAMLKELQTLERLWFEIREKERAQKSAKVAEDKLAKLQALHEQLKQQAARQEAADSSEQPRHAKVRRFNPPTRNEVQQRQAGNTVQRQQPAPVEQQPPVDFMDLTLSD